MGEGSTDDEGAQAGHGVTPETFDHGPTETPAPARTNAHARRLGGVPAAYLGSVILLGVAAATGLTALAIFPRDRPVAPSTAAIRDIGVEGDFVPLAIKLRLRDRHRPTGTLVDVTLEARQPHSGPTYVRVEYPVTTQRPHACDSGAVTCYHVDGEIQGDLYSIPSWKPVYPVTAVPVTQYQQTLEAFLRGVGYNAASNSVYAAAAVPDVEFIRGTAVDFARGTFTREHIPTGVTIGIGRTTQYSWTGNPPPQINGSDASWSFSSTPSGTAVSATGVSLAGQDAATKYTFIAGALLGIAGGALVAAIQEAISSSRRRRAR